LSGSHSPCTLIRRWHHFHHKFQGANLKILSQFEAENLKYHLVPEWLTSLIPAAAAVAYTPPYSWAQATAATFLVVRSIIFVVAGIIMRGRDSNHVELERVEVCKNWLFVGTHYHALHHVFPGQYMSSVVKLLDYIMGTAAPLHAGRRFIVTGAGGALGSAFVKKLTEEGATVDTLKYGRDYARDGEDLERFAFHDKYPKLDMLLGDCDVLVLCHGVKSDNMEECVRGNCTSQLALIERYLRCHEAARKPNNVMYPEVWCVGSEAEFHPLIPSEIVCYGKSKRQMMRHAAAYMQRRDVMYRHIVPAAFQSKMGPGLVSADWMVRVSLWFISRGAQFVPASYTPFAYLHWFKMMFVQHACAADTLAKTK